MTVSGGYACCVLSVQWVNIMQEWMLSSGRICVRWKGQTEGEDISTPFTTPPNSLFPQGGKWTCTSMFVHTSKIPRTLGSAALYCSSFKCVFSVDVKRLTSITNTNAHELLHSNSSWAVTPVLQNHPQITETLLLCRDKTKMIDFNLCEFMKII